MEEFVTTALLIIGASATTTGVIIAGLRVAGPLFQKLFGSVLKTRAQLDSDRDRIIANLRAEVGDLTRRLESTEEQLAEAREEVKSAQARVGELEKFIRTFLGGTKVPNVVPGGEDAL